MAQRGTAQGDDLVFFFPFYMALAGTVVLVFRRD